MDHQALAARLEILKWRDEQFEAVTDQLEQALPALHDRISETLATADWVTVMRMSQLLQRAIRADIEKWAAEQAKAALERAGTALDSTLAEFGPGTTIDSSTRETMLAALETGSGASMIAGSLVAIPSLLSLATITTTSGGFLGFFATTTAAISLPVVAVGGAALGLVALVGSRRLGRSVQKTRGRFSKRIAEAVDVQVMGYGLPAAERSILSDIQAMIQRSAEERIEGEQ